MEEHYAHFVVLDNVGLDEHILAALDHKNALLFRTLYQIFLDFSIATSLATESDICLEIATDVIAENVSWTTLFDQNTLTIILIN